MNVDPDAWLENNWRNRFHSLLLLSVMGSFLALLGWLLWGEAGIILLGALGFIAVFINPSISPRLVMGMYRASPISPRTAPELVAMIEQLALRAGLQVPPQLYYIPSRMLNAFAVGSPSNAAIGLTDGLLRHLSGRELLGVLAHETSHIRNNDLWIMGVADLFSRATSTLSLLGQLLLVLNLPLILWTEVSINWLAITVLILAPTLSSLSQLALSRTREYDADLNAVRLTGDPQGLASALLRLERIQGGFLERIFAPGRRIPEPSLLRTHPDTNDRILRLKSISRRPDRTLQPERRRGLKHELGTLTRHKPPRRPGWHISGLWH